MTTPVLDDTHRIDRDQWIAAVGRLVDQVEQWCRELNWSTRRQERELDERPLGTYRVPSLRARLPNQSELYITPIALHIGGGGAGRVDLESWPSLNRVRLVRRQNDEWEVWTDSNVRLREPWNRETFAALAGDLAASA
jgi:hypothetical protein